MAFDSSLKTRFQNAHDKFDSLVGETFTIEGDATEYTGCFDPDVRTKDLRGDGMGFLDDFSNFSLHCVADQFGTIPDAADIGKKVTRLEDSKVFRIISISYDTIGVTFMVEGVNK